MLTELTKLFARLNLLPKPTPELSQPADLDGQPGCELKGTVTDDELRRWLLLKQQLTDVIRVFMAERQAFMSGQTTKQPIQPSADTIFCFQQTRLTCDYALRTRFDIDDGCVPMVTEGWKVYQVPAPQHACDGCGGCGGDHTDPDDE